MKKKEEKYQREHKIYMIELEKKRNEHIQKNKIRRQTEFIARQFKYLRKKYVVGGEMTSDYNILLKSYLEKDSKHSEKTFKDELEEIFKDRYINL